MSGATRPRNGGQKHLQFFSRVFPPRPHEVFPTGYAHVHTAVGAEQLDAKAGTDIWEWWHDLWPSPWEKRQMRRNAGIPS